MTRETKVCRVLICDRPFWAHELCSAHLIRLRRYGDVRETVPIGAKVSRRTERSRFNACSECGVDTAFPDEVCRSCRSAPCVTCHEMIVTNGSVHSGGECRSCWRKRWRANGGAAKEVAAAKRNPHYIEYQREYYKRPEVKLRRNARRKTTYRRKKSRI